MNSIVSIMLMSGAGVTSLDLIVSFRGKLIFSPTFTKRRRLFLYPHHGKHDWMDNDYENVV